MNTFAYPFGLIAQGTRLFRASEQFRKNNATFTLEDLILGLGLLLAAGFGLYLLSRLMKLRGSQAAYNNPREMFDQLCTAHSLSRTQQRILLDLARFHDLDDPGRLFLEPDRFDKSQLDEELLERASELFEIRDTLFASPDGDGSPWLGVQTRDESPELLASSEPPHSRG